MTKFKTGDKVVCVKDWQNGGWLGMKGTVVRVDGYDDRTISVDFKRKSANGCGHDFDGRIQTLTGWNFMNNNRLELVSKRQLEFDF